MKKRDAAKHVKGDASLGHRVEAHAADALRELWDRTVDNATLDPQSRLVTPTAVREAIEARLLDVLPKGSIQPKVRVSLNATRTGFDIDLRPGDVPDDVVLPRVKLQ